MRKWIKELLLGRDLSGLDIIIMSIAAELWGASYTLSVLFLVVAGLTSRTLSDFHEDDMRAGSKASNEG